jgi:hypothetical protein
MKLSNDELGRLLLEYDPANPRPRFFATATEMAVALAHPAQTVPVPFPAGLAPTPVTPSNPAAPQDPLPKADVLLVTWTTAEAEALATLFTPSVSLAEWFDYRHNVDTFIPKVTGQKAPFNGTAPRYRHSLGLYYATELVGKKVLCFKSGLHMDYDGPAVPLIDLWKQIIDETNASLVITTGTGGGIGTNILLRDVVIAGQTVFNCTKQFKNKPFNSASFTTSPLSTAPDQRLTPEMLKPNADKLIGSKVPLHPDGLPKLFFANSEIPNPKIVSTDRFAFDNTTNTEGLQDLGNVCDMGDATLGLFLSTHPNPPKWVAIRNASDPQIDGSLSPTEQGKVAGAIYRHYGPFTTAASVLACWSVICGEFGHGHTTHVPNPLVGRPLPAHPVSETNQRQKKIDPAFLLLQVAASTDYSTAYVPADQVPSETRAALQRYLISINVNAPSEFEYRRIQFADEARKVRQLYLIHVRNVDSEEFLGTYLYFESELAAKEEFVSS